MQEQANSETQGLEANNSSSSMHMCCRRPGQETGAVGWMCKTQNEEKAECCTQRKMGTVSTESRDVGG